jgi:hypothetical protein
MISQAGGKPGQLRFASLSAHGKWGLRAGPHVIPDPVRLDATHRVWSDPMQT